MRNKKEELHQFHLPWKYKVDDFFSVKPRIESRLMSLERIFNVKRIFKKSYDFLCRRHSLINRPCYNNLFQFMQHHNFVNLNGPIFTHWKHLESRVNTFWYCFTIIKWYIFHYLMKTAPIAGNQNSLEI